MKTTALRAAIWMAEFTWIIAGGLIPTLLLLRLPWPGHVTDTIANAAVTWLYHNYELVIAAVKTYTFVLLVGSGIVMTWVATRRWQAQLIQVLEAHVPAEIPDQTPRAEPPRRRATPAPKRKSLETT